MSDSTTPFGTVATGQGDQVAKSNSLFDAVSPAAIYAKKYATTSGLTFGFHGGKISINGVVTTIADGTLALSGSSTNYIYANPSTGALAKSTVEYPAGYWRIGRAITGTASITTWYDDRFPGSFQQTRLLARAFPTDANYTALAAEVDVDVISITAGVISTTRDFILPITFPRVWVVKNNTAQSVRFIGSSGTGITVATLKTAIIMADGTNIVRITADT